MCLWLTSFHVPVACTQRHLHPLCTRSPTYTYPRPKVASYRKPKPAPSSSAIHLVNLVIIHIMSMGWFLTIGNLKLCFLKIVLSSCLIYTYSPLLSMFVH